MPNPYDPYNEIFYPDSTPPPPPAPMERNIPPQWSDVMHKWSHQPGGCCTCGCARGGWSDTEKMA